MHYMPNSAHNNVFFFLEAMLMSTSKSLNTFEEIDSFQKLDNSIPSYKFK